MRKKSAKPGFFEEVSKDPSLLLFPFASIVPGLGQVLNKQYMKALLFFLVPILLLSIELGTGNWQGMQRGYERFPVLEGETALVFRDYGGYISRSLSGLGTLGNLVIGDSYRGEIVQANARGRQWASADNSAQVLARGLIASVILLIFGILWFLGIVDAYKSRLLFKSTGESQTLGQYLRELWDRAYVWIMIAPAAILIVFFTVIPFIYSFLVSFTNWTYKVYLLQELIKWNGIQEYLTVFSEPAWLSLFLQVFGWTIIWAILSSITVYILGFAHALVIESPLVRNKKVWRTILIIPWAMPALISLLAFRNVFHKDGLMNQILIFMGGRVNESGSAFEAMKEAGTVAKIGLSYYSTSVIDAVGNLFHSIGFVEKAGDARFWFTSSGNGTLAKFVSIMVNLWLGAPYFMMLITGIMTTIPADRYEAAMIDGASSFQRFRYVTLPMVINATIPAMIMTVTFNFNNFGSIYFLTGGAPNWDLAKLPDALRTWSTSMPGQTDILISWIYKISNNPVSQLYSKAAVYTVFIFVILGIFSVVNMKLTKAFNEEGEE